MLQIDHQTREVQTEKLFPDVLEIGIEIKRRIQGNLLLLREIEPPTNLDALITARNDLTTQNANKPLLIKTDSPSKGKGILSKRHIAESQIGFLIPHQELDVLCKEVHWCISYHIPTSMATCHPHGIMIESVH